VNLTAYCSAVRPNKLGIIVDVICSPSFVSSYTEAHPYRVEGMKDANEIEEKSEH
jgi:hypothetical protein